MNNKFLNVTADGTWQTLVAGFPRGTYMLTLQSRTATDCYIKNAAETDFYTVKSGDRFTLQGKMNPGDVQVRATNGVVIELVLTTGNINRNI